MPMIKNRRPRLASFVSNRTQAPTIWQTVQAILVNTFAYSVIIGGIFYIASTAEPLQPAPTEQEKTEVREKRDAVKNAPTFHTHQGEARKVCKGKVVPSGDQVYADWVVVTRTNGDTVRMPLDRAFKLNSRKDRAQVWVIGICKKDLLDNPLR